MGPAQIRRIRKALNLSQEKLAHLLGVTWITIQRWESDASGPTGMALRILLLLEQRMNDPSLKALLRDRRAADPMFVVYSLLGEVYSNGSLKHRG